MANPFIKTKEGLKSLSSLLELSDFFQQVSNILSFVRPGTLGVTDPDNDGGGVGGWNDQLLIDLGDGNYPSIEIHNNDASEFYGPATIYVAEHDTVPNTGALFSTEWWARDSSDAVVKYAQQEVNVFASVAAGAHEGYFQWSVSVGPDTTHAVILHSPFGAVIGAGAGLGGFTKGAGSVNALGGLYDVGSRVGEVLLTSNTITNAATLDLVLTSYTAFRAIRFVFTGLVPQTDGQDLLMRTSTDGGANYDAGAGNYDWATMLLNAGGASVSADSSTAATSMKLCDDPGNASGENISGEVYLFNQVGTTVHPQLKWSFSYKNNAGNTVTNHGGGSRLANADVDAVRFLFASGNLATGKYAVYGLN